MVQALGDVAVEQTMSLAREEEDQGDGEETISLSDEQRDEILKERVRRSASEARARKRPIGGHRAGI